ncbi:hypothetical protein BM477_05750 [Boudabousia marimammalium]|uniref:Uncharacterized protein n=1 Tax=Boudabousia marimammalium TaxID=156892 RepID=A0A1Q5PMB3_9ACTO|nr:hypothetical protein BM477_05750 [Boudabousia marimammalium]
MWERAQQMEREAQEREAKRASRPRPRSDRPAPSMRSEADRLQESARRGRAPKAGATARPTARPAGKSKARPTPSIKGSGPRAADRAPRTPSARRRPTANRPRPKKPQSGGARDWLAGSRLLGWTVPKQPFHSLHWFEWGAWVLLYLGIALMVIAAIVIGIFRMDDSGAEDPQQVEARSTTEVPVQVYRCELSDLDVSVKLPSTQLDHGKPVKFALMLSNKSDYPCNLEASPNELGVKIVSGPAQVYDPKTCGEDTSDVILIAGRSTVEYGVQWDGHSRDGQCKVGDWAEPGTYVATPFIKGDLGTPAAPFVIK